MLLEQLACTVVFKSCEVGTYSETCIMKRGLSTGKSGALRITAIDAS
jgi:hypothetical protein